ncbi:MAG TPA: hypothetical protein VMJ14_12960 [Burkholderiales bacterium]|nr:hypothetical protein [Burkholderiales bacterium]
MRYLLQSFLALGVLIALPIFLEAPESLEGQVIAGIGALILVGLAFRGIVGFVRSRKPKAYPDSVMVPKQPPKPKE